MYELGLLRLDIARHTVAFDSRVATLSPTEFPMLTALLAAEGRVVSRGQLDRLLLRGSRQAHALHTHLSRLRQKLIEAGMKPDALENVHGTGHRHRPDRLADRC